MSILFVLIILLIGIVSEFGGYLIVDKKERESVIEQIRSVPQLPKRFYELYNLIHKNTVANHNHWSLIINNLLINNKESCPCNDVAYFSNYYSGVKKIIFTFHIEKFVTQKECLNFLVEKYVFFYGCRGIKEASKFYYKKEMNTLTDKEMIELIVMMNNPSLFNKLRHPDRLEKEVNKIINEIL